MVTTSLPMVAYATTDMDDETAYTLTRTFWGEKEKMGRNSAWWNAVSGAMLENVKGKIHPGAVRYYKEAGIPLAEHHL